MGARNNFQIFSIVACDTGLLTCISRTENFGSISFGLPDLEIRWTSFFRCALARIKNHNSADGAQKLSGLSRKL